MLPVNKYWCRIMIIVSVAGMNSIVYYMLLRTSPRERDFRAKDIMYYSTAYTHPCNRHDPIRSPVLESIQRYTYSMTIGLRMDLVGCYTARDARNYN